MSLQRPTSWVVEILRVLVIIFGAAVGLQIARSLTTSPDAPVLGLLTAPMIGVIVGAGLGYSLGGALSRRLVGALDRGEQALGGITPEELVSGSIGALVGAALVALVIWPVFLVTSPLIALSLFAFAVILAAAFGFTVAQRRRSAVLETIGSRAGVAVGTRARQGRLIDSSAAIDGRIIEVVKAGFGGGSFVVCQPVLDELQQLADASDQRRREKGRRGLDTLEELRRLPGVDVTVIGDEAPDVSEVDAKLVTIARERSLALLTVDSGLAKVAAITGVQVQNLHTLSLALRPPISVGDLTTLSLIREGKEVGQAVGYLDDGTMVVVDRGSELIGNDVTVEVTSILMTSNGRMAFARRQDAA
ncbi:MAG: hypothetical protein U0R64_08370 [Candidatus Nanopelagicales bacterium]